MMHFKTMLFGLLGLLLSLTSFANSEGPALNSNTQPPDCSMVSNQINNMIYLGEYNNSKYYCSNTNNFTWHQAKSAAESNGGHLLIINDAAENEYIRSNIMADYVWLGLTDENSESNFTTVQGQSPPFINWEAGEPNNNNGNEHYVRLLKSNGKWTDRTASFQAEYVLEIPCPDSDNPLPPTGTVCTTRSASNIVHCNTGETYGGWLKIDGEDFYYSISNGELIEYSNGTATYTARWTNNEQSNIVFDIDVTFTGKTETAPNTPKEHACLNPNTNDFYYYQNFSGTLKGKQSVDGAIISINSYGAAPQIGVGANATGTANAFGMSAWFSGSIIQQPNSGEHISLDAQSGGHIGDINIKLSGGVDDCENCADSDNDGTCNVDDCEPNNPNVPATPGTSCNDANPNTINDIYQADGCTCAGTGVLNATIQSDQEVCPGETVTLVATFTEEAICQTSCDFNSNNNQVIAIWDLEQCVSFSGNGSNEDYSEMTSATSGLACASVTASKLYRHEGKHSCTDDSNNNDPGDAVCLGMPDISDFVDDHPKALRFDVTIAPNNGNGGLTKITFNEFAPSQYIWSQSGYNDTNGTNNYPTKYGIRVLKNGVEVFKAIDLVTSTSNWAVRTFDFSNDTNFQSSEVALYQFELLAYDLIGNGAQVAAWDIDEIQVFGGCCTPQFNNNVSYLWSNGATTPNISVTPDSTATFGVTVTDCNGATSSDEATITLKDADNDNICDDDDCDPNNPNIPTTPGTACDDNDPNTLVDVIQADGCTCLGTPVVGPNISINDITVNEDDGIATLQICLDQTTTVPVSVDYATEDATAIDGADYNNTNATVTIPPGETCATITVDIIDDENPEDEEIFVVNLTNPENGQIGDPQSEITIVDNDVNVPNISINDVTVNEDDGIATLQICLDQTTTVPVSVGYATGDAAAIAGTDYIAKTGQATIPAGETCVDVPFDIIDDENPEDTEPFFVDLNSPVNANISDPTALITIVDNDANVPNISINDITVNEDDGIATLQICLDQTTTVPVSVDYATEDATAIDGADYNNTNATVTIPPGETCATITIDIIDDENPEDEEIFVVNLTNPENGQIGDPQSEITIVDNDVNVPNISINDVTVNEDDGIATLQICLDQTTTVPVSVGYATGDAAAIAGTDYIAKTGQATIPAGETCVDVPFDIIDDENPEDTEPFFVDLNSPVNANISDPTALITIVDNDANVPNISINDITVNEDDGIATLQICLDQTTTVPVSVDYATEDATAIDGADYNNTNATITIPAGETCATITVDIIDDENPEDEEIFVVNLTNPENGQIGDPQSEITIVDNDVNVPNISINDITVNEDDGIATLQICLDQTTTVPVSVGYATGDAAAIAGTDYIAKTGQATIPPGETCVDVPFDIIDDENPEDTEPFFVDLNSPVNANISDPTALITILDNDVNVPNISINDITVNEDDGTATLEICLDQTTTVPVSVDYATEDATAIDGADYNNTNATVTIPAGETCATITVDIIDDENPEDEEKFVINLTNPENGQIGDPQSEITIVDNDVNVPNISINDVTVNEDDGIATLQICLDQTTTVPVSVGYATGDAAAIAGTDYIAKTGQATIPAGETCVDVPFDIIDDENPEDTEPFFVDLNSPVNANISDPTALITILDNDANVPNISINDITVNEDDGTATLQICLDQTTTVPVSVDYATEDATAIDGADYNNANATVTIPAGETCATITIDIIDDENPEDEEIFVVNLTNPENGQIGDPQSEITIVDNDVNVPNISINDVTVNEDDGIATLQICLDQTTTVPVSVGYATGDAAAIAGTDYIAKTGQATIPAGETCVDVPFDIIDDENPEDTEPFFVDLNSPVNANISDPTALITILDNDANVPNISINDITVNEDDGTATLEICLDQTTTVPVSVDYATEDATAIDGADYNNANATVTIPAGETCATITIDIIDDENPEDEEKFVINLTNPENGQIGDPQSEITIVDNDVNVPNISINDITVNEDDGIATLEICLDQTTTVPVSVDYATEDATAIDGADYNNTNATVTIPPGETCATITVDIIDDENPEDEEIFVVNLTNPENGQIGDPQSEITIVDNDVNVPNISINDVTVNEDDGIATLQICLDQTTTVPVSVGYATGDAAAIAGTDYIAKTGQATIPAGETCVDVPFDIIDDENPEDTEPFFVDLNSPVNANISDPTALITIVDNDANVPNISINDITVNEDDGIATLQICLDQTTTVPVSVDYATEDATAIDGADYNNTNATVTIPPGETCATITIDIIDDENPEDEERFVVNLTNPENGQIGDPQSEITIVDNDVNVPNISINDITVNEDDGIATLQICLDQTTTVPVSVDYATEDATAIDGADYNSANATITIPAGETCLAITFDIIEDGTPEDEENFVVNLTNPTNGEISDPQGTVTIQDSDVIIPNISINETTVNEEDGIATLQICLDQTTTVDVSVNYATSDAAAIAGSDYVAKSAQATIPAGETCVEVTFEIIDDENPESTEPFFVNLSAPVNGNISNPSGLVTILDSDVTVPNISINDITVNEEDGTATLEICLDQTTTVPVSVDYATADASAIDGSDYNDANGTVTIPAGETCVAITFDIIEDGTPEEEENFVVNLTNPTNGEISDPQGTVTILDSDVIIPNISINDVTVNEEDGTATLEICLDQTTTIDVSVNYATADGSAEEGLDFNSNSGTITIPAGQTCVDVTFDIVDDNNPEDTENFVVNLTNPTNGNVSDPQGMVTILDSDVIIPNISISDITVDEEDGTATLEICLDQTTTVPVSVNYSTADATAVDGSDYNNANATVTIPAGLSCIQVTFDIIDDEVPEDTEYFVVNLDSPTNGVISDAQGTVTILDTDEEPPVVPNITINDITVNEEDGTATLQICLDQTTTLPVTVNYATSDAAAISGIDYEAKSAQVIIPAGETCVDVTFVIIDDENPEPTEPFFVNLSAPVNGNIGNPSGLVTILDTDEEPPVVPNITINDITVNEEDGTATLQICLDQTTTLPVTVNYATSDAAAIAGIDYEAKSAQVTIPAGETCVDVTFVIIDDENPEPTEPFFVNLSAPINGNIGNPSGLVTILDTDEEPPVVPNITINDITVNEEDGTATLQICLDQTTTLPVTVNYATSDAAAIAGIDYEAKSAQVTIPAGETCVDVTFVIIDDENPEPTEPFFVNLSAPINGNIANPSGLVTILDTDEEPCPDADEDGICDSDDCAPNDPSLPTSPGTACNDNNTNTINDVIQADGCTCAGDAPPCDLTVELGGDMTICNGDNAAITAMVDGAAVCTPPDCSSTTLVTYNGSCDDPTECLFPSGIASCLSDVSGICPTEGPVNSSCNNNIICIASMFNSWDFTMTADSPFEFKEIEADFWYPTDGSNAGGTGNSSSCPTSYDAIIKFFVDDVLIATKVVNVEENQILTKIVGPDSPILVETGSTLRVEIGGTPDDEDCDLFELAGLRVNGCCSPQTPLETNTYSWSGPGLNNASTATVFVSEAGTYCVTVTDCSGCTSTECMTVAQPSSNLNAVINVLNMPSSANASNGVLQVAASGGAGPYTYYWSNDQTNSAINGLAAGDYDVTVTDNNGCTSSSSTTLNARAIIGDKVWNDENQNGIQDAGEEGIPGVAISINGLQTGGNIYTDNTVSQPDGSYSFDNLDPGEYEIGFTAPQDYIGTVASAGNNPALDSDADANSGNTGSISVGFNDVIDDVDAGFYRDCSDLETDFTISEPICINSMAIFDAFPVGTGASYNWYFFNGPSTSSTYIGSQTGQSVGMSFSSAGQKLVKLNVEFEGCEFSVNHVITVLGNNDPACSSCSNITDGGQIGNDQSGCAPFNPGDLTNITAPTGGNGTIQYRWAASISGAAPQGFDDPNWTVINTADQIIYKPGTINQTTYYVRFSRRSGCEEWTGMSNVVEVEVLGDDISAEFEVLSDPICSGSVLDLAAFDVGTNAAYDWYFFNGPSTSSTFRGSRSGQEVNFTFTSGGDKLVRLSVTNSFGCSAIIDQVITVLDENDLACANNLIQNNLELRLALNQDDEVMLDWKATNEPGGATYEIEHSLDGINFEIIGTNNSGSKSGNAMLYDYVDDMVSFGVNYYRVKQILVDGQFQYSAVKDITIKFTDGNKGIVFPNPAMDLTTLMFSSPLERQTEFEVVNAQGSIVKRFTMVQGMDRIDLNVSKWQAGYYFIYTTDNGYRQLVNKVLKAN